MKRKNKLFVPFVLIALFASVIPFTGLAAGAAAGEHTASEYINSSNWTQKPGYVYSGPTSQEGPPTPATVVFPADAEDVGIKYTGKGYYMSGSNSDKYSGIVFKNKVKADGFSVTFTINKLGLNTAAGDDGWIGIGISENPDMWHTTTFVNDSAVALIRPQSPRSFLAYVHENARDEETNKKINNFAGGSPLAANGTLSTVLEGATLRFSINKVDSAYYPKLELMSFPGMAVLDTYNFSGALNEPGMYIDNDGLVYFCMSASSSNFDKEWEFTIKNICGVDVGVKDDEIPVQPDERAASILSLIEELKVVDYFTVNASGDIVFADAYNDLSIPYYSEMQEAADPSLNIAEKANELYAAINTMNNDVRSELKKQDLLYDDLVNALGSEAAYFNFYIDAAEMILDEYEDISAENRIDEFLVEFAKLPEADEIDESNEQAVIQLLGYVKDLYNFLPIKAVEKLKAQAPETSSAEYDNRYDEIKIAVFDVLDKALESLRFSNYFVYLDELEAALDGIGFSGDFSIVTMENYETPVLAVSKANLMFDRLSEELQEDIEENYFTEYNLMTGMNGRVDALKEQSNANRVKLEEIEDIALMSFNIFMLPTPVLASHTDSIFALVTVYNAFSTESLAYFSAEEKAALETAAIQSLTLSITAMPAASQITKENFQAQGYDELSADLNRYYQSLEFLNDGSAQGKVTNADKLAEIVEKIDILTFPLASKTFTPESSYEKGKEIKVLLTDLFSNQNELTVTYSATVGSISGDYWTFTPDEAKEYDVSVTITSTEYDQSATAGFKLNVVPGEGDGDGGGGEDEGCKSSVSAGAAVLILALAGAVIFVIKRNKAGKNV